jgi:DNA repair protein RecN (Recombination protein N)
MLKSLRLKDFAIFKDITVQFSEHLCIISGETGAGKSIMVDGMLVLLGARTDAGVVREGAPEAVVEGLFETKEKSPAGAFLRTHGFEFQEELAVKRIINAQGKSRVYINGSPSTLSMLSELTKLLVDIHGQHEHQSLLDEENHIKLLDAYAGTEKSAEQVKTAYAGLLKTTDQYNRLQSNSENLKKEKELFNFQLSEIRAAGVRPEEETELEKEYNILSNAQRMISELNTVYETISGDGNGVIANLYRSLKLISGLQDIDPYLKGYAERLEAVSVELKDISSDLSSYVSRIDMDPQKLEQTEQRIELIEKLKKKYGKTIKDIIEYAVTIEKQIGKLNNTDEEIAALQKKKLQLEKELYKGAEDLSAARKHAAAGLGKTVVQELKTLGMKDAVFEVRVEPPGKKDIVTLQGKDISSDGLDSVRFYFSANLGFPAKPLTDIISGGELSRTMLAIKRSLVKASPVPVLVFDEIDAGIGGTTAEIVGRKLKELSGYHQVICITHLPQIAGFGDYHISVSKHTSSGKTDVSVQVLDEKGRTEEIARMLSGETVSEIARKQAKEFLKYAKERT